MSKETFNANNEAQFGLLPVTRKERVWNFMDHTYVNIGFAIATWCFLIGGTLSLFVDFWTAVIATLSGNMAAVLIMIIGTTLPSAKYGIDTYTPIISCFGRNGVKVIIAFITIFQVAWVIVLSTMFGRSVENVIEGFISTEFQTPAVFTGFGIFAVFLCWLIVWKGPLVMKRLNSIVAPLLLVLMCGMLILITKNTGWDVIVNAKPTQPYDSQWINFLIAFELNLGAGLSWWPNMGGIARLCKTTRAAYWPSIFGLVLAATIGTAIGVATALLYGNSDPTEWMIPLGGLGLGVIALLFVAIANLTSNSIVVYNICLGLKQFKFFYNRSWGVVTGIFMLPVFVGMFCATQIYDNFYILLGFTCTFYCPLVAIQLIDYFIFRNQTIDLKACFDATPDSEYNFFKGFNWVALFTFLSGMPVYLIFLNPVTLVNSNLFQYITATGGALLYAAVVYYVLGRIFLLKGNEGGYTPLASHSK